MTEGIIISVVSGALTLIGVCITAWASASKTKNDMTSKLDKAHAVTETRLDELTREVREHNNVIERTYALERKVAVIEEKLNNQGG